MTQKATTNSKKRRVSCAQIVKEYTFAKLQELCSGIDCSQLQSMIQQYGGVLTKNRQKAVTELDKLLSKCDDFYPAVLMTQNDADQTRQFIADWKKDLKQQRKAMQAALKPIYLADEVTKELQRRGSKLRCTDTMLEHCVSHLGITDVTPEKVCDVVMEYAATDWQKLSPLAKSASLSFALDNDSETAKQTALKRVLWLYRLEGDSADVDTTILDAVANDFKVMSEFDKWKKSVQETCEYISKYKEFVKALKTPSQSTLAAFLDGEVPAVGGDAGNHQSEDTQKEGEAGNVSTGESDSQEKTTIAEETPSDGVADEGTDTTDAGQEEVTDGEGNQVQSIEPAGEQTALHLALMRQKNGETLSADDQKVLVMNKICPVCGSAMIQRDGYNGTHLFCTAYNYKADGTFDEPVILQEHLQGVTPKHPIPSQV